MFVKRLKCFIWVVCALTVLPGAALRAQDQADTATLPGNETVLPAAAPSGMTTVQPPAANEITTPAVPASQENPVSAVSETQASSGPVEPKMIEPDMTSGPANEEAQVPASVSAAPAASQEKTSPESKDVEAPTEWVWGEVLSTDPQAGTITIKHLDYDTYEEVQKVLSVTDKTLFENAKDIKDIKPSDHITADYRLNGNKNEIEMLVVDKLETGTTPASTAGSTAVTGNEMTADETVANQETAAAPQESSSPAASPASPETAQTAVSAALSSAANVEAPPAQEQPAAAAAQEETAAPATP